MTAPAGVPPSVSVIVPCRNEEGYVGRCLDSIVGADYPKDRIEVLVVDGRSDDRTSLEQAYIAAPGDGPGDGRSPIFGFDFQPASSAAVAGPMSSGLLRP